MRSRVITASFVLSDLGILLMMLKGNWAVALMLMIGVLDHLVIW